MNDAASTAAPPRFVVFTGRLHGSIRRGILELHRAAPRASWLILVHAPRKPLRLLLRNQWRNLKRNGWRWIGYQGGDILRIVQSRLKPASTAAADPEWDAFRALPNVRIEHVADIHGTDSLGLLRAFDADLGLSIAAPILKRPLFALPRHGTLNLHKGRVPDYRGMPPAFWELWHGEGSVGCTVHRVDDKLDTGAVVGEATVDIGRHATLRGLQLRLDEVGIELMRDAALAELAGTATPREQPPGGKTHRKPTLAQEAELAARLAARRPATHSRVRTVLRDTAAEALLRAWRLGAGRLREPRINVVLFHRVTDDVRDNLTVGVEQFDRQMALLREHCEVLSIEQVLSAGELRPSERPRVAVTFDDGYLDNFLNAAPVLRRHGLPGAFFVSTGMVEVDGRFPHDVRRNNPPIPTMRWDDLRRMRDWGFTIGSHTVNHADCAAEPAEVVKAELDQSRDDLARELGPIDPLFAYPYGGRQHMTPERLEMVKQAGYVGCLSAYGGSNIGRVDRFNVLRRGIHWEYSDTAFLLECVR